MIKKTLLVGILALCTSMSAHADRVFGLFLGAYGWNGNYSGTLSSAEGLPADAPSGWELPDIDIEDDLGFSDDTGGVYYIAVEHFIPLVPNVKLVHSDISSNGTDTVNKLISLDGELFGLGQDIKTIADFTHTDLTLYYQILDNWVELDVGLTARVFDGLVEMTALTDSTIGGFEAGTTSTIDIDITAPLLYGAAQFNLPLTGLYISVDANAIAYSGNSLTDINANIGYEFKFGLGLMAGYRTFSMELDDIHNLDTDVQLDGPYGALTFHF